MPRSLFKNLKHLASRESLHPDLARALRTTFAMMVPLLLAAFGVLGRGTMLPLEIPFVAIAAHATAAVEIRGPYPIRLGFLLITLLIMAGCTELGTISAGHWYTASLAAAVVALNSGLWRHLSPEYGPSLAIPTGLVFILALAYPEASPHLHAESVLAGAAWALLLQICLWPIRAQHPLRRVVGSTWVACSELFKEMASHVGKEAGAVASREADFRSGFDSAESVLHAVGAARPLLPQLKAANLAAARLVTRVSALRTAMEPLISESAPGLTATYEAMLESLSQTASSIALAVISRQPSHLAVAEVRFVRVASLLRTLQAKLRALPAPQTDLAAQAAHVIDLVDGQLSDALLALVAVTERATEKAVFPLELFDLFSWRLKPLATALNLRQRPDPALLRFTARLSALLMLGVAGMKLCPVSHSYWLPFTLLVVSQTDYGATRKRALERFIGTLIGSIIASGFLFLYLPRAAIFAAIAVTDFCFTFMLRRNYKIAVIFVTIMVVFLIETSAPVSISLTLERVAFTAAGGAIALLAALAFWPAWERRRYPPVLADALQANLAYLREVVARLAAGGAYSQEQVAAKRSAEKANAAAFASLGRLYADPASQRAGVEQAAVIANGCQRLTRFLNLLLLGATPSAPPRRDEALQNFAADAEAALQELIAAVQGLPERHQSQASRRESIADNASDPAERAQTSLLERARTEIEAMQQAVQPTTTEKPQQGDEQPVGLVAARS